MAYAVLRHTTGVAFVRSISGTLVLSSGQLQLPDGAVGTPSLTFSGDTDTGLWREGSGILSVCLNGVNQFAFETNLQNSFKIHSTAALAWTSGTASSTADTILLRDAANVVAQRNSSTTQEMRWGDATNYTFIRGGVSSGAYFGTKSDLDVYFSRNDIRRWYIASGGHFIPFVTNTYNLGASSERMANVYSVLGNFSGLATLGSASIASSAVQIDASGVDIGGTGIYATERTAPGNPSANRVIIYAQDNGAGKTQLMAIFGSGAAQQIAIEP